MKKFIVPVVCEVEGVIEILARNEDEAVLKARAIRDQVQKFDIRKLRSTSFRSKYIYVNAMRLEVKKGKLT